MRYILSLFLAVNIFAFSIEPIILKINMLNKQKVKVFKEISLKYDPFKNGNKVVKAKTILQKNKKTKEQKSSFFLLAILDNKAFINSKWYKLNDKIGKYRIIKISKNLVIIKNSKKRIFLKPNKSNKILKIRNKKG